MTDLQHPLPYGKLAPEFSLPSANGDLVTRGQFRNKSGLAILFLHPEASSKALLESIGADVAEYQEVNARVIAVFQNVSAESLKTYPQYAGVLLLADEHRQAWQQYSGNADMKPGYAIFILDLYGGVDGQRVVQNFAELPDAATILEWTRSAQYRCSI